MRNGPLTAFSILLAAPLFAFNCGFLSLAWSVVANLALAAGLAGLHRCFAPSKSIDPRALFACLAAGVAIAVLGGQGHVFLATPDWWIRDAVFDDLLRAPWPVGYERDGIVSRLRAPLGLYLAPAAAGKIVGFGVAWAIFVAQSAALTGLILHGVTQGQAGRGRWITLTIFVFFSGADIVVSASIKTMS